MVVERRRKKDVVDGLLESKLYVIRTSESDVADLSECGLDKLPSDFFNLCRVFRKEIIDLHLNALTSFRTSAGDEDLYKMDGIMRELNASHNEIRIFPEAVLSLHSLVVLDLSANQIEQIPPSIAVLINLRIFLLKENRISHLPSRISELTSLQKLDISANLLKRLPFGVGALSALDDLRLDCEQMDFPPSEVCRLGTEEVKKYLRAHSPMDKAMTNRRQPPLKTSETRASAPPPKVEAPSRGNSLQEPSNILFAYIDKVEEQRSQRLEELAKEQEDLDRLVEKAFAQSSSERRQIADAMNELEVRAVGVINCALRSLDCDAARDRDLEFSEIDEVLLKRRALLDQERAEWLKSVEKENEELCELACNEGKQRQRQSMEEIAKKMKELDLITNLTTEAGRENLEKICCEIADDEHLMEDLVLSMKERTDIESREIHSQIAVIERALWDISILELKRAREDNSRIAEQLEEERRGLSMLHEQFIAERDFKRKKLYMEMRADLEREEVAQRALVAECLRRYAELIAALPTSARVPRRSVSRAERFGLFKAIFGRKKKFERAASPKKVASIKKSASLGSSCASTVPSVPPLPKEGGSSSSECIVARFEQGCVVCLDRQVEMLLFPCGHVCVCGECAVPLNDCPLCRTAVTSRVRLSNSS